MGNHIFNFSNELSQRMELTHKVQLPYTDSFKKKLQMEANLQLIHFPFNQTPNMFYETKQLFKCSKGHLPNGEEHVHPKLGLLQVRICIILPSQGNIEKLIFLDAHSSLSTLTARTTWLTGISQSIPLRPLKQAQRDSSYGPKKPCAPLDV